MSEHIFKSRLGPHLETFIAQKQSVGFPYQSSARILYHFDDMVFEYFPDIESLTKEIVDKWIHYKPNEHPNGLLRRITPIRQFGKYLHAIGHAAYILPGNIPNKQLQYEAHIFTTKELQAFFHAIDSCPVSPFSPTRCYVIPVLFRLLYCCGLRSSEARLLNIADVNLTNGQILIRESKGWKARILFMSPDLLEVCREYNQNIEEIFPMRQAFFPNINGEFYNKSTIDHWFHEFWDNLPEAQVVTGNSPRVHDLRHTYAVHRLNSWVRENENVTGLYPYLSEYMGHSHFTETDYYLTLVESFYPEIEERLSSINDDIIPEVYDEY